MKKLAPQTLTSRGPEKHGHGGMRRPGEHAPSRRIAQDPRDGGNAGKTPLPTQQSQFPRNKVSSPLTPVSPMYQFPSSPMFPLALLLLSPPFLPFPFLLMSISFFRLSPHPNLLLPPSSPPPFSYFPHRSSLFLSLARSFPSPVSFSSFSFFLTTSF